jgi:hypothetical protein
MVIVFMIECVIGCALFTAVNVTYLLKKPLDWFYDYPEEVQARMRTLPQYQDRIPLKKSSDLEKKLPAAILLLTILSAVVWFSGVRGFAMGALYAFALCMAINLYDALILDTCYFCHSKRVRFPGTEDMVKEYENPKKHWVGFAWGTAISIVLALLVGGVIMLAGIVMEPK